MKMNEVVSATQLSWKIEKSKTASNKLQKYAEAKNYTRPFQCKCLKTFIFCKIGRKTNLKGKKYAFQSMNWTENEKTVKSVSFKSLQIHHNCHTYQIGFKVVEDTESKFEGC